MSTSIDRTIDGVEITPGLRVWNYNLDADVVVGPERHGNPAERTWYITERGMFDGSRMWARHPSTGQLPPAAPAAGMLIASATYAAFITEGGQARQFAIVGGEAAAEMLAQSDAPDRLSFTQL